MSWFSPRSPIGCLTGVLAWTAAMALSPLHAQVPDTLRYSFFAPKTLPQQLEQQGSCVAISGNIAVVGSPNFDNDPVTGIDSGAVKVFEASTGKLLHRLLNPANEAFGRFGTSVAISGSLLVVGSYNSVEGMMGAGIVYVYDLSAAGVSTPLFTIENPSPAEQDQFGHSVAVDGENILVGAWMDDSTAADSGTAYLYNAASAQPTVPVLELPNPAPSDEANFGTCVAISGTRLAVSAYRDDTTQTNAGRLYVFDLQASTPDAPVYSLGRTSPGKSDCLGNSLAMEGNLIAVGAECANSGSKGNAGTVVVFDLSLPNPSVPRLSLNAPVTHTNDYFGTAVALSGTRMVVGCYRDDGFGDNAGTAFVYDIAGATPSVPIASPDKPLPAASDYFGNAVAISGSTVLVAAWHDDRGDLESGATYVYSLTSPTPDVSLLALDSPVAGSLDRFGTAVAIDGNLVAIGSPGADAGAAAAGRVRLHDLSATKPTAVLATLEDPNPEVDENFGAAVAVSGSIVVVGGPGDDDSAEDTGRVYIYNADLLPLTNPIRVLGNPTPEAGDRFGSAVAVSGNFVVVGAELDDAGAVDSGTVYVYNLTSPTPWLPVYTLANPSPAAGDRFGCSVSISGTRVVVGASKDDNGATDAGMAYIYDLAGATPTVPLYTLADPGPVVADDGFGNAVAISGNTVAVAASGKDTGAVNAGVVYVYNLAGATPTVPAQTLLNPDPSTDDRFGNAVAVAEPRVLVGAALDNSPTDSGRSFSFNMTSATPTVPAATQKKSTSTNGDLFGSSVAISGVIAVVGCPSDNKTATDKGAAYVFGPSVPEIAVATGDHEILSGESATFGPVPMGNGGTGLPIDILNTGITNLTVSGITVSGGDAADFSISAPGFPFTVGADSDRIFTVTLNPSAAGTRATTLRILNNDSDEPVFEIQLSGRGLSPLEDTDGDGLNDVSEFLMAGLGFNWQVPNPSLVAAFSSYRNSGQLFEPSRVQAIRVPQPVLQRDPVSGVAKLTLSVLKSSDFHNYVALPFTGAQTSFNPAGEVEFRFTVPDNAAFYRLETK